MTAMTASISEPPDVVGKATTINERIMLLIKELKMNKSTFATSVGKAPMTMQTIVGGRNKPGYDVLEAILMTYPQVSSDWLLLGKGEMFRPTYQAMSDAERQEYQERIDMLENMVRILAKKSKGVLAGRSQNRITAHPAPQLSFAKL